MSDPSAEPICVVNTPAILGESVLWHPVDKKIYWLDIVQPRNFRFSVTYEF